MDREPGDWMEVIRCETANRFVDALRPTHQRWSQRRLDPEWLYRGVCDEEFSLKPSAWRISQDNPLLGLREALEFDARFDNFMFGHRNVDKPPFGLEPAELGRWKALSEDVKRNRIRRYVVQVAFELQLLHDFWKVADKVGHQIEAPNTATDLKLGDLLRQVSGGGRETLFETQLTATAQHHGVPTRLLDWTMHSLSVIENRHVEDSLGGPPRPWVRKLVLPKSEVGDLSQILWRENVTLADLKPSFDSVKDALSDAIRWWYRDCSLLD